MTRIAALLFVFLAAAKSLAIEVPAVEWIRQIGTSSLDENFGIAGTGNGTVFVSGDTGGNMGGSNAGYVDALLSCFDPSGNLLWTQQKGTAGLDTYYGVVSAMGAVYATGITEGNFGGLSAGRYDSIVSRYDAAGNSSWVRQFGTSQDDFSFNISVDGSGNAYAAGETSGNLSGTLVGGPDAFLIKYAPTGTVVWTRQFGSSGSERAQSVFADATGNVYLCGATDGVVGQSSAGGTDVFVAKYDSLGTRQWIRQLGTSSNEVGRGVASDPSGNVYISGFTTGSLEGSSAGSDDAFVAKYSPQGNLLWVNQFGTNMVDSAHAIAVDGFGNVYVSGDTLGRLGAINAGGRDVYAAKFDTNGSMQWVQQFGTTSDEWIGSTHGIFLDTVGDVFLSGTTFGNFGGVSAGSADIFVLKLRAVPEPSSSSLGFLAILVVGLRSPRFCPTSSRVFVFR